MAGKSRHNRDLAIAEALARGEGQTAAAQLAGCSVSTIRRRLENAEFRDRVERLRTETLDAAAGRMGAAVDKAVAVLLQLMEDTTATVRLGAARSVCDFALRVREAVSLERRILELEKRTTHLRTIPNESP